MEEAKTLILSLEFDTEEGLKRAANFRSAIDADKEALAELNKVIKKNGEANEQQLVEREKLEQNIKKNVKSRGEELRAIENYLKATKNSIDANGKYNGSINNLRGNLSLLTAKWNDLTKEERENVKVGGVLQKEVKRLSDELKELEGSVGDNRRNVGGYLDAIRQAPGALGKMKAGVQGVGLALNASPLGLLTNILPQIIGFFNSSGEGADFFAKAMGGINAVLQVGMKYLVKFAGYLVDIGGKAVTAFSSPKKLLTDLVDFLINNFLNRIKGFLVVMEGIKNMDFRMVSDGILQVGTGVTNLTSKVQKFGQAASKGMSQFGKDVADAANAGAALEDRLDKLAEKERAFALASAETERQIEKLLIQARNRQTSEADRIKLLEKAEKLELRRNDQELALARQRVQLVKEQNRINQEDTDAQDERLKESQKRVIELERQSENIREKIQVRKDALLDAAAERDKKRREETEKAEAAYNEKREKAALKMAEFEAELAQRVEDKAKELEEARKESLKKQIEANNKYVKEELAQSKLRIAQAEKEARDKIALKEKEFQVLVGFSNAASGLAAALANETTALADFQKAVSLFQIGLASAEAYTKGVAASQDLPFPGNLIAMGTTIAAIATNLLQAKQLISGGSAPKYKAAEGGILSGPSHAEGGITGTGRFANVEVEGGEAIISKRATALFAPLLSAINIAGGGKPLANTNYAAMGGYLPGNAQNNLINNGQIIDYNKLAKAMAAQPAPVVGISDIKAASARKDERNRRVTLGA